jgi:hypothetical protein
MILFIFSFTAVITRNYESDWVKELDQKQHKLKGLYPICLFFIDKFSMVNQKSKNLKQNRNVKLDESFLALYVGESLEEVKKRYLCNKLSFVILILLLFNLFSVISNMKADNLNLLVDGRYIKRPSYNDSSQTIDLHVLIKDKQAVYLDDKLQIEVGEKQYTSQEILQLFHDAKEYIDNNILAENKSVEEIVYDLNFITNIPNTNIKVSWSTGNQKVIDHKGRVINDNITESLLIPVTTLLKYKDCEEEYTRYFKVLPKIYTKEEQLMIQIKESIEHELENSKEEEYIKLPNSLKNYEVLWYEEDNNSSVTFFIIGVVLAILLYVFMDYDLQEKVKLRNQELLLDYSELISKFTLLVGAGMSLINAWSKITNEYKVKGGKKRYLYEEMIITYGELTIGTSEIIAYERFGRRIKLIPYLRFSSLLAQNVKKGSGNLLAQLDLEVIDAFEERKELVKRIGEEAGTKLLLPMMLMLVMVLTIIIVPAFLSFQI